jgi:penicillin-binding protein 1A
MQRSSRRHLFHLAVLLGFCLLGIFVAGFRWVDRHLPSPYRLRDIQPPQKTIVLDIHEEVVHEFFRENRDVVPLAAIPKPLVQAILATEDRKFYEHWGVDVFGVLRAITKNVRLRRLDEGGSTITQQLAKNLFLTHDRTWRRKLQELVLALRIERIYSKDEILELYLNQVYFGDGAYGVQAAARTFFGKDVNALGLAESALLAGLPGNPRDFNPRIHPEAAHRRRQVVLNAMLDTGAIDKEQARAVEAEPLAVTEMRDASAVGPYFVEVIRQYLTDRYGSKELYEGGLRVYTTLDLELQRAAEAAVERRLLELEKQVRTVETRARYEARVAAAESAGAAPPPPRYLQGALICLEARTGYVNALVGGRSFRESPFNRATQAQRQPGSAFKPFIYTAAIDNGFRASDLILDTPVVFQGASRGQEWRPQNYSGTFSGPMTLRYALKKSVNIPAIKLMKQVGISTVASYARRLGITSPIHNVLSTALGTSEVSLIELTAAYTAFANQGVHSEPVFVLRVEDRSGQVLETNAGRSEEVLSAETSAIVTDMLADVLDSGTAAGARGLGFGRPAAGKTGTTDNYNNGWFIGFTPEVVCGVWVGYDSNVTMGDRMEGARIALPIWTDFMIAATGDRPALAFPVPSTLVSVRVCNESGMPAIEGACPETYLELFKAGTAPETPCSFHGLGGGSSLDATAVPSSGDDVIRSGLGPPP